MWTDFHLHILPGIDDGSKDVETSLQMLGTLKQQQVDSVFATPHFLLHQHSVSDFSLARAAAWQALIGDSRYEGLPKVLLGAENAIEPGLSQQDCKPLCYEGLSAILLELPRQNYKNWMREEIENIRYSFSVTPVLAHLERYLWYEDASIRQLLQIPGVIVQVNARAFSRHESLRFLQELYESGCSVLVGSDAHNCGSRPPDFNLLQNTLRKFRYRKWSTWLQKSQEQFLQIQSN